MQGIKHIFFDFVKKKIASAPLGTSATHAKGADHTSKKHTECLIINDLHMATFVIKRPHHE